MNSITPRVKAPILMIGSAQPEYLPIQAAMVRDENYPSKAVQIDGEHELVNTHLLAFQLDPLEIAQLEAGEPLYVGLLTLGGPMTPIRTFVGTDEAALNFGVEPDVKPTELDQAEEGQRAGGDLSGADRDSVAGAHYVPPKVGTWYKLFVAGGFATIGMLMLIGAWSLIGGLIQFFNR